MEISSNIKCTRLKKPLDAFPDILFLRAKVVQKVNQSYATIITRENTDKIF
jgi:hypothetical protein